MSSYKTIVKLGTGALFVSLISLFGVVESNRLQAQDAEGNTTIDEISDEENVAVGEEVTVRGEVEEFEPGISFVLEEEGFLEGDEVLVINVSGGTVPVLPADDLELQVTGEVGNLIIADIERDYGLVLDPDLYVDYENQPVILAQSMVLSPDLEDIAEDPEFYYLQTLAVEGEVDEVRSNYTFTLKEEQLIGGDELLMINASGNPIPESDETVVVTGTVRPYVRAEFDRDYDLTWDLDVQEEIEAEYTEQPVFVVDDIFPSAVDDGLFE